MKRVAIIDYGSGNLRSAVKAFERAAAGKASIVVTDDPAALADATHIVLPGVGAFADCMQGLTAAQGILPALTREVLEKHKPFLGVCVGMQMLFDVGHEHGLHKGLSWIKGKVVRIESRDKTLKIPHMGWNDLKLTNPADPLLRGIHTGDHAYFVHSYHAICDASAVLAITDYGGPVTAIVRQDNIMGTQFHPEKSQKAGLQLISNFLALA